MALLAFDHVNVRTTNLKEMVAWYGEVLGLHPGKRPDFGFPGAWLYLNDTAVVHLVEVSERPTIGGNPSLEHFAFQAEDFDGFVGKLEDMGVAHTIDPVPGMPMIQVNFRDVDGNHIHVDFVSQNGSATQGKAARVTGMACAPFLMMIDGFCP